MKRKKKSKKRGLKLLASEGPAVAGKEGFGKDMDGKGQGSSTPLAHPWGWAGGFNVLRTDRRACSSYAHGVVTSESSHGR